MALYYLNLKIFTRGKGSSVTQAAAYRAGERMRDERSSRVHDYSKRADVVHSEILLPAEDAGRVDLEWALNRCALWNAVQQSGRFWNSRLAREVLVFLPSEMTSAQRVKLTRTFSQELADRFHSVVDFAVHEPRAHSDQRSHHGHILMTCRQIGPDGVGARTILELSGTERHARGLGPSKNELLWMRERWQQVANQALRDAGLVADMDHRGYRSRGLDREPKAYLPRKVFYAEHHSGVTSPVGDTLRARHRERVEARAKGGEELARVLEGQKESARQWGLKAKEHRAGPKKIPYGALSREQRNALRHEWYKANKDEINRKDREWCRANAEEVNRKQREYYHKYTAPRRAAKRALEAERLRLDQAKRQTRAPPKQRTTAHDPASPGASAEQSVQNWLDYRQGQKLLPEKESLNRWVTYRETQADTASPASPSQVQARKVRTAESGRSQEAAQRNNKRGRKHDAML